MFYPNGMLTIRKLEEMIDDSNNWRIIAENKYTQEQITLKDRSDLREYIFYDDYCIAYDFIGNWKNYKHNINSDLFDWKFRDIEIRVKKNEDGVSAEIVKWENNKVNSEDLPNCFDLAYWNSDKDFVILADRFFKYIPKFLLPIVFLKIHKVNKILAKLD